MILIIPNSQKNKLERTIGSYIEDLGLLHKKIKNDKIEFGFELKFPKGKDPTGKEIGRTFNVVKPKKEKFIEISCGTKIAPEHYKSLESLKRVKDFYLEITKVCLMKDLFYIINEQHNLYVIKDNIYLDNNYPITINLFMESVRKVSSTVIYSLILLNDYTSIQ